MEGLNDQTNLEEVSNVQIANQREETVNNAFLSTFDQKTAAPTDLREISASGYAMIQQNEDLWPIVCKKLREISDEEVVTIEDFIEAILFFTNEEPFQTSHRRKQRGPSEFMLRDFFRPENISETERMAFQDRILPGIVKLVLDTPILFPDGKTFPLLRQDNNTRVVLSRRQCACLLAHMVMCLTRDQGNEKLAELINFSVIYGKAGLAKNVARKIQKIKCIFQYFETFFRENQDGTVVFERSFLEGPRADDEWSGCDETLTPAEILAVGAIEDTQQALQVVFSDKQLGDQVLQLPATQQQIMSLIHPELMLSILFCEELQDEEAVRVYGARRYSNYKGYGDSFEFTGAYKEIDVAPREHVIMDAEKYHSKQAASQFAETCVVRELNKAYAGFQTENLEQVNIQRVATGKWGCGVFRGNPQLKFMIQWLAASRAGRGIVFYTYNDNTNFNIDDVRRILNHYEGKEVQDLYKDLDKANLDMQGEVSGDDENKNLFGVLIRYLGL